MWCTSFSAVHRVRQRSERLGSCTKVLSYLLIFLFYFFSSFHLLPFCILVLSPFLPFLNAATDVGERWKVAQQIRVELGQQTYFGIFMPLNGRILWHCCCASLQISATAAKIQFGARQPSVKIGSTARSTRCPAVAPLYVWMWFMCDCRSLTGILICWRRVTSAASCLQLYAVHLINTTVPLLYLSVHVLLHGAALGPFAWLVLQLFKWNSFICLANR